jgi:HdeA/HdeB family
VRVTAAAVCVLITVGRALAQQPEAGMMGAGSSTCADYVQAYRSDPDSANDLYFGWAQGYMSGQNVAHDKKPMRNLNALPISTQLDFLKRFCEQKPTALFAIAAQNLFNALPSLSK